MADPQLLVMPQSDHNAAQLQAGYPKKIIAYCNDVRECIGGKSDERH
jgi:hypothetical protein